MRAPILRKLNLVSDRKYTPFLKLNDQSMMSKYQDTWNDLCFVRDLNVDGKN